MAIRLRVDPTSGVPLGAQIERQIRLAVAAGRLAPGERLPSARELADELGVNFHTVRKAYGELQAAGLLDVGQGRGTFVTEGGTGLGATAVREVVREHVGRLAADLAGGGVAPETLESVVVQELRRALSCDERQPREEKTK